MILSCQGSSQGQPSPLTFVRTSKCLTSALTPVTWTKWTYSIEANISVGIQSKSADTFWHNADLARIFLHHANIFRHRIVPTCSNVMLRCSVVMLTSYDILLICTDSMLTCYNIVLTWQLNCFNITVWWWMHEKAFIENNWAKSMHLLHVFVCLMHDAHTL